MVQLKNTRNADTRTASHEVNFEELYKASSQHIKEVQEILGEVIQEIQLAGLKHDYDKVNSSAFFNAFHDHQTGKCDFIKSNWYKQHFSGERHHNFNENPDVNFIDLLEMIADVVAAVKGRQEHPEVKIEVSDEVLQRAFKNTVEWINNITLAPSRTFEIPPNTMLF